MTERRQTAESCLIAACVHLSMMTVRNENFAIWVSVIRDVIPDCEGSVAVLMPVKVAAEELTTAEAGDPQHRAMTRLRWEIKRYFEMAAARRFDAWKRVRSNEVIE